MKDSSKCIFIVILEQSAMTSIYDSHALQGSPTLQGTALYLES